jgi:hypothetical protein
VTCERCEAERRRADAIKVDLDNAEVALRAERRSSQALRNELRKHHEDEPGAPEVRKVLKHWKQTLGHEKAKTPMEGARAKAVRRMLNAGYSADRVIKAIDGCARRPFVGPKGRQATAGGGAKRFDDLTLICRDEATLERFEGYAMEAENPVAYAPFPEAEPVGRTSDWRLAQYEEALREAMLKERDLRQACSLLRDMLRLEEGFSARLWAELEEAGLASAQLVFAARDEAASRVGLRLVEAA